MNERTYKYAFVIAVMVCLVLAGALAYVMRARTVPPLSNLHHCGQRAGGLGAALACYSSSSQFLCTGAHALCNCRRSVCRRSE